MSWNLNVLPFNISDIVDSVREKLADLSHVQVDPTRPVAGCRIEKVNNQAQVKCFEDRERLPAAQAQGLQCRVVQNVNVENGKPTLDLLLYCGPKTVDREVRRAKAYFGQPHPIEDLSRLYQLRSNIEKKDFPRKKTQPGGF